MFVVQFEGVNPPLEIIKTFAGESSAKVFYFWFIKSYERTHWQQREFYNIISINKFKVCYNFSMSSLFNKTIKIFEKFDKSAQVVLLHGDILDTIKFIPDKVISLIITSPPYNIGKVYEKKVSLDDYLAWQHSIIKGFKRVLKDDASVCWQVGNYIDDGEVFPLDTYFYRIFKEEGFKLRNRIIWKFGHGLHCSKRFSGRYETILWFSKGDEYKFNLDNVRIPQKYPGKRQYKGDSKGVPSCNPKGKNPSDVWNVIQQDWDEQVWDIPNVKSNHPEKTIHPCQFPIELVERCVLALTDKNDWVLDPYCGVGSAIIAAIKNDRKGVGCDKEKEFLRIAEKRIQDFADGNLKTRPIGKPVFIPTGKEKVSQIPTEWQNGKAEYENSGSLFV